MIDCIVSSKDRACQLDLTLRSMALNYKELSKITVLYKASDPEYQKGYDVLMSTDYGVPIEYVSETSYGSDYRKILSQLTAPYFMGFNDDNMVITDEPVGLLLELLKTDDTICTASLRLNPNYNYCQPANKYLEIPEFIVKDKYLKWDWTKVDPFTCWGYPHPGDNNIYRMEYYKELISRCTLSSPSIEGEICCKVNKTKPYLVSLLNTKILTTVNNITNDWGNNPTLKEEEYSLSFLNKLYLEGKRIDLQDIIDNNRNPTSGWTDYKWKYLNGKD